MFEIAGTIKKVFEEQTFGSGFNKREFVLTIASGRFPQDIKFECVKDKVALVASLEPGDKVKVSFDLRGREWKENYYVNLNAWKITPEGPATAAADGADGAPLPEEPGESVEDVPFLTAKRARDGRTQTPRPDPVGSSSAPRECSLEGARKAAV